MLGWVHFHPFAALMIPIRHLHQFLLSGNPLPKKVTMKSLYVRANQTKENFGISRQYLTLFLHIIFILDNEKWVFTHHHLHFSQALCSHLHPRSQSQI
jgi:hypothetical protein